MGQAVLEWRCLVPDPLAVSTFDHGGKYHCTIGLLFDWFGISCMTTDNFCFYLQNRLIKTSQTGGQWHRDTSPLSIPCSIQGSWAEHSTTVHNQVFLSPLVSDRIWTLNLRIMSQMFYHNEQARFLTIFCSLLLPLTGSEPSIWGSWAEHFAIVHSQVLVSNFV
jgi:hypothetical protein